MSKLFWPKSTVPIIKWQGSLLIVLLLVTQQVRAQSTRLSPSMESQEVSVSFVDVPIAHVLEEYQKLTGTLIIYSTDQLDTSIRITLSMKNSSVEDFFERVFENTPALTFEIQEDYVLIKPNDEIKKPDVVQDNFVVIKGKVTDVKNIGLPGVTIMEKYSQIGSITDVDGNYSIRLKETEHMVLVFSFVGLLKQEIEVEGRTVINVIMQEDQQLLGDVVVTGYQEIDEDRVAGAVSKVDASDLKLNINQTLQQSLQGKLAGVAISNPSGQVGVRQTTRVRGTSTLSGSAEPIWVVDGIIQEDPLPFSASIFNSLGGITNNNFSYISNYVGNAISWLNPNDIKDITVLKDASATAIYGVRAANGVIVIQTKKGERGPASISYSGGVNVSQKVNYNKLELMNSKERIAVSREIYERGLTASWTNNSIGFAGALTQYQNKEITYQEFNAAVAKMETTNTDWFDWLFRNPVSQSHSISLSSGTDKVRVYSSLGYNSTKGTAIGNDQEAYTANLGITNYVSDKLDIFLRASGSFAKTNAFYQIDPYEYATKINRVIPAYDENGDPYYYTNSRDGYLFNVMNELKETGNENKNLAFNTNLNINYHFSDSWKLNVLGGLNLISINGDTYATERSNYITKLRGYEYGTVKATDPLYAVSRLPIGGEYNAQVNNSLTWNIRPSLNYNKVLAGRHAVTAMLGAEVNSSRYTGYSSTQYGYMYHRGKSFAAVPTTLTNQYGYTYANTLYDKYSNTVLDQIVNTMGYYLTLNYAYDSRYVANLSVRGDASNRFGQYENERFNPVWAGGVRWNVSNEHWFHQNSILTDLSFRATAGYQRNMSANYSPNLILSVPTASSGSAQVYDRNTGDYLLDIKSLPYKDLRWEQTVSYNLGLNMNLFSGKVNATVDYYDKKGTDLITTLTLPRSYGIESMPINGGKMTNKGLEVTLGLTPVRTNNFTWSITANAAKNVNTITKSGTQTPTWQTAVNGQLNVNGYAASSLWAFKYKGVDQTNGHPIIDLSVADGVDPTNNPTAYMKYVGNYNPDITGGFSSIFRYKNFGLSANFYVQMGGKRFLTPFVSSTVLPSEYENLPKELTKRWTPTNPSKTLPGLPDEASQTLILMPGTTTNTGISIYEMYNYSTARVVSASTLRCNNVSMNYAIPPKACGYLGVQSVNLSLGMSNPFSIVSKDFHGRDAEVATGNQPRTRAYTFNMSINF